MQVLALMAVLLLGALPSAAHSASSEPVIAVIVATHDAPDLEVDRATLRDVFLKRVAIDRSGQLLVPVNLAVADPLREAFSEALLARAPQQLEAYWNGRYFQGVTPPYVLDSQEAVVRFVSTTPGAIGYVAPCYVDARVHVVLRLAPGARYRNALRAACPGK